MKKIGLLFAILFLSYGCATGAGYYQPVPDGKYDNHVYLVDTEKMSLEAVKNSVGIVITKTVFEIVKNKKESFTQMLKEFGIVTTSFKDGVEKEMEGGGIVLFGRYFLTAEHVVSHSPLTVNFPFGTVYLPYEKSKEDRYLRLKNGEIAVDVKMKALYVDHKNDIALFEFPAGIGVRSFPYALGNSDNLRVGNFTYVVGFPGGLLVNVREGIVSALSAPEEAASIGTVAKNAFMVSNGLNQGASGPPILAIRDGEYELVGLVQGTILENQRLGWAIRINAIRDLLLKDPKVPEDFKKFFKKGRE